MYSRYQQPPTTMAVTTDSRFDTTQWATEEANAEAGPSRSATADDDEVGTGSEVDDNADLDEDEGEEEEDDDRVVKGLSAKELEAFERKQRKRGIIYISRIPPGMTVPKVRHLLSGFGQVERIFLHDGRRKEKEAETGNKKCECMWEDLRVVVFCLTPSPLFSALAARRSTQFTEGWVELSKKSVAKIVAATLNAQPIGFSSGGRSANKNARRWKDDVWTMKYLPGFKWHMLSEQMAHERAAHASRLRTELSQSRFEQQDYLKKVERARVQRDKEEKRRLRAEKNGGDGSAGTSTSTVADPAASAPGGKMRTFKQRQPVLRDVRDQRQASKRGREEDDGAATGAKKSKSGAGSAPASAPGALSGVLSKIL